MDSKRGNRAQSDAVYFAMFRNTLKINVHTIFFYDTHENYLKLSAIRNESYPTTWVQRNLSEFTTYQRLPDLSAMWMEKIEMVHHASKIVDAEWYAWIDAGIVPYRNMPTPTVPWPEKNLTAKYPHNKFIYHNFQGRHAVSGTAYLVPSGIVEVFRHLFFSALEMCLMVHPTFEDAKAHYHDDQDILKVVVTSHPHLCYNDPIQGLNWGALVTELRHTPPPGGGRVHGVGREEP